MKVFAAHGPMVEVKPDDCGSLYVRLSDAKALVDTLVAIEAFGHGTGHGRGYSCATMAAEALAKVRDVD